MTDKEKQLKKLKATEARLEFIYREVFYIADKIEEMHSHQKEMSQLFLNIIELLKNNKDITDSRKLTE